MTRDPKSFNEQLFASASWTVLNLSAPKWQDTKALLAAQSVALRKLNAARERKTAGQV
jgi:hypothetical protein